MKKILVLLALGILLLGCASNAPPAQPAANQTPPGGTGPATVTVHIKNFAFSPAEITVNRGDTVQWVNDDGVQHLVKFPDFQSDALGTGAAFQHTFSAAGEFPYACGIHPSMQGKVIVK